MKTIGGSFGKNNKVKIARRWWSGKLKYLRVKGWIFSSTIRAEQILDVQLAGMGNKTATGAMSGAVCGLFAAGPVGMVLGGLGGGLSGAKQQEMTFTVLLRDGRSLVCMGTATEYSQVLNREPFVESVLEALPLR